MPGAEFNRVFWDIITGVTGPTADERKDDGSPSLDENRVAVVIEDEADIRQLLSDVLESAGFVVYAAASGLEGIERVRVYQPVVTTLDVSMPGIDGFETAKRIRAISSTYIVMLTARSEEIDALQGLESGADDYITKPFPSPESCGLASRRCCAGRAAHWRRAPTSRWSTRPRTIPTAADGSSTVGFACSPRCGWPSETKRHSI